MHRFADMEVRIDAATPAGYPLEVTAGNLRVATAALSAEEYTGLRLDAASAVELGRASSQDAPAALDAWLAGTPALASVWAELRTRHPRRRIRLRLSPEAPELHAIPWELWRCGGPVALSTMDAVPLSRYLPDRQPSPPPIYDRPLRLLVAVASPPGLTELQLPLLSAEAEIELARQATAPLGAQIVVEPLPGRCTLASLVEAVRSGVHLLHLAAHGAAAPGAPPALLLEDEDGQVALVTDAELAEALGSLRTETGIGELRLVLLAACRSGAAGGPPGADESPLRGLAPALVRAGVPAVIAMQDEVPESTALVFSRQFYASLCAHGAVDLAVNEARDALRVADATPGPRLPAFAIPTLYSRLSQGQLLGVHGHVEASTGRGRDFWAPLLEDILEHRCVPIVGARALTGLLPASEDVAAVLARRYGAPFRDPHDLARVADFVELSTERERLLRKYLSTLKRALCAAVGQPAPPGRDSNWPSMPDLARQLDVAGYLTRTREADPLAHLAALPCPLYLSCTHDPLLEEALRAAGKNPRSAGPDWSKPPRAQHWNLDPAPTEACPVVFHLFGYDDGGGPQSENLILSEDDWFRALLRFTQENLSMLPGELGVALSRSKAMILGVDSLDWEFRVLFHALFPRYRTTKHQPRGISVQLDSDDVLDPAEGRILLQKRFDDRKIDVYWGSSRQFLAELVHRLDHRQEPS